MADDFKERDLQNDELKGKDEIKFKLKNEIPIKEHNVDGIKNGYQIKDRKISSVIGETDEKEQKISENDKELSLEGKTATDISRNSTAASVAVGKVSSHPIKKTKRYKKSKDERNLAVKNYEDTKENLELKRKTDGNEFKEKKQAEAFKHKANKENANTKLEMNKELFRHTVADAELNAQHLAQRIQGVKEYFKVFVEMVSAKLNLAKAGVVLMACVLVLGVVMLGSLCAFVSSPYGIMFADDTGSDYTLESAMQEINAEFAKELQKEVDKHSGADVKIDNRGCGYSLAIWSDIVAVWDVKTNMTEEEDVFDITKSKFNKLKNIAESMYSISTNKQVVTEEVTQQNGKPKKVTKTVVIVSVNYKSIDDMVSTYSFNKQETDMIYELVSDANFIDLFIDVGFDSNIDFSTISFGNEKAGTVQQRVSAVAMNSSKYGITAQSGMCQGWVDDVMSAATGSRSNAHCANCAGRAWGVSRDWSKIQVGATVYGYASNPYGHVGIYIGNGLVAHNLSGCIKVEPLEKWVGSFKGQCWGWNNGNNLSGDSKYNSVGGLM